MERPFAAITAIDNCIDSCSRHMGAGFTNAIQGDPSRCRKCGTHIVRVLLLLLFLSLSQLATALVIEIHLLRASDDQ